MPMESELRKHRCCFTGHRPEKLRQSEKEITPLLEMAIRASINDGFVTFISGMARGVDIWAAEIVLRLRDQGAPIHLICASPYEGFERSWSADWQKRYRRIWAAADYAKFIFPAYRRDCFQRRNEWMVDHSAQVIAVYNGEPSGTKNTIKYAQAKDIPVINILSR